MIPPDACERENVGTAPAADASDASDASRGRARREPTEPLDTRQTLAKQGPSHARAHRTSTRPAARRAGPLGLLDSFSPDGFSASREGAPSRQAPASFDYAEPFECAVARETQHAAWPIVVTARGTGLVLVRLSLTTPREDTLLEDGARFAAEVGERSGEGVLLARDIGPRHGRQHFYGIALAFDPASLSHRWCALTGANPSNVERKAISGWAGAAHSAFGNLGTVLGYAFKPWPPAFGMRSLDRDVFASGVFAAPWRAALAGLLAPPDRSRDAHGTRRTCLHCGSGFDAGKRSHARWCSPACRSAAWEHAHPQRKAESAVRAWRAKGEHEADRYAAEGAPDSTPDLP